MIYTVTCNPAIDYVVQLSGSLKQGEINRNQSEAFHLGGKGINVSHMLRELGHDSVSFGFVAGFTGEALENGLKAGGLSTHFIHVNEGMTRINVKVKATEETEINGIGPVVTEGDLEKLYAELAHLESGDFLVLSGSLPKGLPATCYEDIMKRLAGKGIHMIVDAAGELLLHTLKHHPFLIKPNHHELAEILGKPLATEEEILAGAQVLQKMGAKNVLVSMAGDGAVLLDEDGRVHRMHCPKGQVISSVGAGDSMVAGFLAGMIETKDYDYALKLGVAAGSATAFSVGLATKEQVSELLKINFSI